MPTAAAPVPAAAIQSTGQGQFLGCIGAPINTCTFQGEARNVGVGCATVVRGVTRFLNAQQQQVGSAFSWNLPSTRVVRANEAFTYDVVSVPQNAAITTYATEPAWTNVSCQ